MMNRDATNEKPDEISLLICEFMGINIGIDMVQVMEICEVGVAESRNIKMIHLYDMIENYSEKIIYDTPRALLVEHAGEKKGVVVDMPREIASIPVTSIRPLPGLIELFKDSTPVWGVGLIQEGIVLLINLLSLFENEKN